MDKLWIGMGGVCVVSVDLCGKLLAVVEIVYK